MTVSRVLNGGANVRPEMRRRVEKSVAKLRYRRNENARSIRPGQRTGLVGVIITNITNPYYAQVLLGIEDTLASSIDPLRTDLGRVRAAMLNRQRAPRVPR